MWFEGIEEMPIVVSEEENKNIISSIIEEIEVAIARKLLEM